ncbi:MAG: hypothetical protein LBR25_03885 [Erysipelotrichaceae bacterium]|jgi:hypothetical protein|nr:hypothetical protein [Erysipelotrichaceae bacterium]
MRKIAMLLIVLLLLTSCKSTKKNGEAFAKLTVISLAQLDEKLANGDSFIAYFGWVKNCGDSLNIQNNYFEDVLNNHSELYDVIYVIDLDIELPEALADHDLRQPLTDAYTVAYSPTLLEIRDGEIINKIEWTPVTSDPDTGIAKSVIDDFFAQAGYPVN